LTSLSCRDITYAFETYFLSIARTNMKTRSFLLAVIIPFLLSGCGGGNSTPPPPSQFTIGGSVTNLAGSNGGLQLQDNGGKTLSVGVNGSFMFSTPVPAGSTYDVTISQQPTNPSQTCGVVNGTGTATANVTNVMVDCGHNEWTWMGGSNLANQSGMYGTQGTPAAGNIPGGRGRPATWADKSGDFWLFGGGGYDSAGTNNVLNDVWKYSNGQWTWVGGSDLVDQAGVYGTLGTPSASDIPGARCCGTVWTDASGNVWFFGGNGISATGAGGNFNDLWKYSAGEWTWMAGSSALDQSGAYGTLGTPSASNTPGGRAEPVSWTDSSGSFWLFGGNGYDSAGTLGFLNDLWKFSNGQWTWMGGSNVSKQKGIYGTLGTHSASNIPGARRGSVTWTDAAGNVWLFGGFGYDSAGTNGELNDLWKFSNGEWTWMGGSETVNQPGVYGTEGVPSSSNFAGAREQAEIWTDAAGNVWLFGGFGYDAARNSGFLSDLWKYSGGQWTWMGGSDLANQVGTYGTLGTPLPGNVPGARWNTATWIDAQGNLWLFGGHGYDSAGKVGQLNDLWKYEP
jgi:N-acetylneuraminic acid mutarotase